MDAEHIEVYALFARRGCAVQPLKFRWHQHVYTVREITYHWETAVGATRFLHFAAADDAQLFELVLNTKALTWELHNVE